MGYRYIIPIYRTSFKLDDLMKLLLHAILSKYIIRLVVEYKLYIIIIIIIIYIIQSCLDIVDRNLFIIPSVFG